MSNNDRHYLRPIRAVFYSDTHGRKAVKINRGKDPESMCLLAHMHLRYDHYDAMMVEVFNEITGKLHAVLRLKRNGMGVEAIYHEKAKETPKESK